MRQITYWITQDSKEWFTNINLEQATIKADEIKGQVFIWRQLENDLILVYSHGERQLRLS